MPKKKQVKNAKVPSVIYCEVEQGEVYNTYGSVDEMNEEGLDDGTVMYEYKLVRKVMITQTTTVVKA